MSRNFQDLSHARCRFVFDGPDALRYLNGQVTQDVRLVASGRALPACVTNAKGRMEAEVMILPHGPGGFLVDGPKECREFLGLRLEKYLIADDCALRDVTDETVQFHFSGENLPGPATAAVPSVRMGLAGWDWVVPAGEAAALREAIRAEGWTPCQPEEEEDERIRRGIAVWGRELDSDTLPPEAGLEASHISYTKGCYIGQEVISRLKSVGQVVRRLCHVRVADGGTLPNGAELLPGGETGDGGRAVGKITSVRSDGLAGLAYVRRPHHVSGTLLRALPNGQSMLSVSVVVESPVISQLPPNPTT